MRRRILLFAFVCSGLEGAAAPQTKNTTQTPAQSQASRQFFPAGVFDDKTHSGNYKENWYAYFLTGLDEPSLFQSTEADIPIYRFLLVWNARALCVRLALNADGTGLVSGKLVTMVSPKHLYAADPTILSKEQAQQFALLLRKAEFWSMETEEPPAQNVYHMDGAQWILEGTENNKYHVVDRWSPRGTAYEYLCKYLMELSPVKLDQDARNKNHN